MQEEIKQTTALLNECNELRSLFIPSDDYPTYESMVDASADWALDNHEAEEWSIKESMIAEMVAYKMMQYCHIGSEIANELFDKLNNQ